MVIILFFLVVLICIKIELEWVVLGFRILYNCRLGLVIGIFLIFVYLWGIKVKYKWEVFYILVYLYFCNIE